MKPSLVDFMMKILLLLALLTGSEGSSVVVGVLGGDVTLPCAYDSGRYGRLSVCWGRGSIPASGCGDQLVSTDGHEAAGPSGRHRLLGRLEDGDVSMTILNVSRADAGRYGCRVDIPGWFNDDKHHFDVDVEEAPQTTTSMTSTGETTTTNRDTTGHVTSTQRLPTSSSSGAEGSSSVSVVLVCVLLGLASLVAAAVFVIALRRTRPGKISRPLVFSSLAFRSPSSREPAVENVYQMEADGGEYEYCP
uniref:hepatitis A virus cellular receptor 1 homolog isoform X5 n=1 Tax=Gasterosteus aculeatus aculeatus TaxID=481459 RepID=UPI001A99B2EA|nr:hepatitis A virus cellular receptor 1 homolog isoform X5 [Gasterosteus aculeatus aculeatus]